MNGISTKLTGSTLTGAITGVGIWIASLFGLNIPGDIGAYFAVILGFAIGWWLEEKHLPASVTINPPTVTAPAVPTTQTDPVPARPAVDVPTIPQP